MFWPESFANQEGGDSGGEPFPEAVAFLFELHVTIEGAMEDVVVLECSSVNGGAICDHVMTLAGFFEMPAESIGPLDGVGPRSLGSRVEDGGGVLGNLQFVGGILPIGVGSGVEAAIDFVDPDDVFFGGLGRGEELR